MIKLLAEIIIFNVPVEEEYVTVKVSVKAAFNLVWSSVARVEPVFFLR